MRCSVPQGFSSWWDGAELPHEPLELALTWQGECELGVGQLHPGLEALRFAATSMESLDNAKGGETAERMIGKALTRAGWLGPTVDPAALLHLVEVRSGPARVEFILDTNAMVEGIGHWLADYFADRCDLVVTAVSLRELQDKKDQAGFGQPMGTKSQPSAKRLASRQTYLAASRFREQTGYDRILWRELELDDTALLLSRGAANTKGSESDTLLLRAVRRSIHARVNNLERFFVTGDTSLARRAATELPARSVIAAQVAPLRSGDVLFPRAWWPGPDQGYRVSRHVSRLVWELLCIGDAVTLKANDGRAWTFRAFDNPMWPSDYVNPWINVESTSAPANPSDPRTEREASVQPPRVATPVASDSLGADIWAPTTSLVGPFDHNLRLSGKHILDVLAILVRCSGLEAPLPAEIETKEQRSHVRLLLDALDLADVNQDAWTARPRSGRTKLADAWLANDRERVFDVLRPWVPLEEWTTLDQPPKRPERTPQAARGLAQLLGQGMYVEDHWLPGGRRPTVPEIRAAVLHAVSNQTQPALPVYTLLVNVLLRQLGIAPVRVVLAWDALWRSGVFEGFEPREGGSSSGSRVEQVARFTRDGWELEGLDLESCGGTRDLLYRSRE